MGAFIQPRADSDGRRETPRSTSLEAIPFLGGNRMGCARRVERRGQDGPFFGFPSPMLTEDSLALMGNTDELPDDEDALVIGDVDS